MKAKVGFVGAGNMAGAIINGILSNTDQQELYAYDIDRAKCERFGSRVNFCDSLVTLAQTCECLFFAVKPQIIDSVLEQLKDISLNWSEKILVTLVAGMSTDYYAHKLPGNAIPIVRIMPNTPIMLGSGATTVCANTHVTSEQLNFVKSLLSGASYVRDIPEEQMNAAISVNGSSPAYLFLFAKAVVDYAKSEGIDENCALELFANTMIGSARMLMESDIDPQSLIRMVTSPGGTTLEALRVFEANGFEKTVFDAMSACTKRAEELGK